ncbi:MAG: adenylate/guanylate cyclase domain-containing protein [Acidimicrobiia bacterium]
MDEVTYAPVGDGHVAYRVLEGRGTLDVVMVAGTFFPMDLLHEDRVARRFMDGLAALGRLIAFDKRGVGLSDTLSDDDRSAQEHWADDLDAVIEASGADEPVVVSWEPLGVARLAASRPGSRIGRLVLLNPEVDLDDLLANFDTTDRDGSVGSLEKQSFPSRYEDPSFREWLSRAGRVGASPTAAGRLWDRMLSHQGTLTPEGISAPTLVIHRQESIVAEEAARAVAAAIDASEFVQLPGRDLYPLSGDVDDVVAEISRFVTGSAAIPPPERAIGAVLFTDLVSSTERAVGEGDDRWRELLDVHDSVTHRLVTRFGGRVVKYTGDGVLAVMPSATCSLRAARSIQETLAGDGLAIRAGVHVGDIDRRGDDVSGIVVNAAARIMGLAGPGEVLVSESVRVATMGSDLAFDEPRTVDLKGVPDTWRIHRWIPHDAD